MAIILLLLGPGRVHGEVNMNDYNILLLPGPNSNLYYSQHCWCQKKSTKL